MASPPPPPPPQDYFQKDDWHFGLRPEELRGASTEKTEPGYQMKLERARRRLLSPIRYWCAVWAGQHPRSRSLMCLSDRTRVSLTRKGPIQSKMLPHYAFLSPFSLFRIGCHVFAVVVGGVRRWAFSGLSGGCNDNADHGCRCLRPKVERKQKASERRLRPMNRLACSSGLVASFWGPSRSWTPKRRSGNGQQARS